MHFLENELPARARMEVYVGTMYSKTSRITHQHGVKGGCP